MASSGGEEGHGEVGMKGRGNADGWTRRTMQAAVGGLLAVAVTVYAVATSASGPRQGSFSERGSRSGHPFSSKLYAWTNGNDRSRGFRSSIISGVDADDPAFSPGRALVPPVDRVIAQLKGHDNPRYFDAEHHGTNAQYVNGRPPAPPGGYDDTIGGAPEALTEAGSGTSFVVDPAATDEAQFNINLLLRKSGRMGRDASQLAELQGEDQQLTAQYDYASKRAASLLALEGDMKDELLELSQKQLSIIAEIQNMTANATAETEAIESDFAAKASGDGASGKEGVAEVEDPEAPKMPSIDDGNEAAGKERGRVPMLAGRERKSLVRRHLPAWVPAHRFSGEPVRAGESSGVGHLEGKAKQAGGRKARRAALGRASDGGHRGAKHSDSVAAQVSRAGLRAEKSAARVGTLLKDAERDVKRQAAAARLKHEEAEKAEAANRRPSLEAIIGKQQYAALNRAQDRPRVVHRGAP